MDKAQIVQLRHYIPPSDESFVYKSWLDGLYFGNKEFNKMGHDEFHEDYRRVIKHILAKEDCVVIIACLKEDNDVIIGFSVTRPTIIDWVFVRNAWRRLGIGKDLVSHIKPETVTHTTIKGNTIRIKYKLNYHPFK